MTKGAENRLAVEQIAESVANNNNDNNNDAERAPKKHTAASRQLAAERQSCPNEHENGMMGVWEEVGEPAATAAQQALRIVQRMSCNADFC